MFSTPIQQNPKQFVFQPYGHSVQGQGVVEYAGSLVIAALLISLAMFIVPEEVATLLNTITTTAIEYFMESMPS